MKLGSDVTVGAIRELARSMLETGDKLAQAKPNTKSSLRFVWRALVKDLVARHCALTGQASMEEVVSRMQTRTDGELLSDLRRIATE